MEAKTKCVADWLINYLLPTLRRQQ